MRPFLHEAQPQSGGIAPRQPPQGHQRRPPEEDAPQAAVAHPEGFQQADHPRPLQHEDQQRRSHVEKRHHEHDADNHRGIHVMGLQPVENIGVPLPDARHGEVFGIFGIIVQQRPAQRPGERVGAGQRARQDLVARNLVRSPLREPLHVADVRHDHHAVHLLHPRLVDARHLETVAARHFARLDEQHLDLVAHAQQQFVGQRARQQDVLRADLAAHTGQLPRDEPFAEIRPVVIRLDTLEHHLAHGVGRADDAPLDGIGSHRHEPVGPADQLLDMRAAAHGLRIERVHAPYVGHRDVSRKPRHLARHLAFEAHDDGHREDHHRHPQRHRHHGDTLHHPGLVPGRGLRHAACDEKGEIHGALSCRKFVQSNI